MGSIEKDISTQLRLRVNHHLNFTLNFAEAIFNPNGRWRTWSVIRRVHLNTINRMAEDIEIKINDKEWVSKVAFRQLSKTYDLNRAFLRRNEDWNYYKPDLIEQLNSLRLEIQELFDCNIQEVKDKELERESGVKHEQYI